MANVLPRDKQLAVLGALVEGNSVRSTERMFGVHRDTIIRLMVRVGQGCSLLLDEKMVNCPARAWSWTSCGPSWARSSVT